MPTVDETGRWDPPSHAAPKARRPASRLEQARDSARHAHEEYRRIAREVADAARLARAAIGAGEADALFERVHATRALSNIAFRHWRQAQRAFERERRIVRRTFGIST